MTYTALDDRTAKRISDLVGTATHLKTQRSFSGAKFFRTTSESEQEHGRPLLTPDEVLRLPYEDALLLVGGVSPYRARKLMYYLDGRFKECVKLPAPDSPSAPAGRAAAPARLLRLGRLCCRPSGARPRPRRARAGRRP